MISQHELWRTLGISSEPFHGLFGSSRKPTHLGSHKVAHIAYCIFYILSLHTGFFGKQCILCVRLSITMLKTRAHSPFSSMPKKKSALMTWQCRCYHFLPFLDPAYKEAALVIAADTSWVMPVDELQCFGKEYHLARQVRLTVKLCSPRHTHDVLCSECRSARHCWNSPTRAPGSWGSRWPRQHKHHPSFRFHQQCLLVNFFLFSQG